jgi:large repetitive protein
MVRSALVCALVMMVVVACARPVSTLQTLPTPTPSPSPTPTAPLVLAATAPFHIGEVGVVYAPVGLSATGGVQPYTWSISAGALPGGLSLTSDGTVSGTPNAPGSFHFTVQVADAGGSTATIPGSVPIAAHLSASLIAACATQCSVELGCVNVCGAFGQLSGGLGPYSYSQTSGQLPSGTSLSGFSLTGTFSGLSGYLQFSVKVTDGVGATATLAPLFWMYQHISLTGGAIPACPWPGAGPNDPGCTATFPYVGGTPNSGTVRASAAWVSYACNDPAVCTHPPAMPTITVGSGIITVAVPQGTYANTSGYKGTLTITLTNQDVCSAGPAKCSTSANVTITQASG